MTDGEARRWTHDAWIKTCAGCALLIVAGSVAYYFLFFLPHERNARLEMERQEGLAVEQREREKLEMQRQAEKSADERLSGGRIWPIIQLKALGNRQISTPGHDTSEWVNVNASLRTSWRDGRLYYRLTLAPDSTTVLELFYFPDYGYVKLSELHLFLDLLDSSGFKIGEIDVAVTSLSRIVDTYQRLQEIRANESVPFSRSDYLRIDGWSLNWRR